MCWLQNVLEKCEQSPWGSEELQWSSPFLRKLVQGCPVYFEPCALPAVAVTGREMKPGASWSPNWARLGAISAPHGTQRGFLAELLWEDWGSELSTSRALHDSPSVTRRHCSEPPEAGKGTYSTREGDSLRFVSMKGKPSIFPRAAVHSSASFLPQSAVRKDMETEPGSHLVTWVKSDGNRTPICPLFFWVF